MTDKEINEAIAEACGIRSSDKYGPLYHTPEGYVVDCPNYCKDLNAMHEAEKTLNEDQMWRMARNIELNPDRWYFHASARDRAEAFLRTLGKWEEAK